jgi:hypothetical protein
VTAFLWNRNSGNFGEKVAQLPLGTVGNVLRRVIYSMALPPVNVGDLIQAWATFEASNETPQNVMVGRYLTLTTGPGVTTGTDISEAATRNITPDMHHDHIQDFGSYRVSAARSGWWLNYIAYAGRNTVQPGEYVIVEQDYGRLMVNIYDAAVVK